MSRATLELSIALSGNERTRPLIDGTVTPNGIRLLPTEIHPSEMFWRQLKYGEFDVSEMSAASFFIAVSRGETPWVALPIYTMRQFFHTGILVRVDSGIVKPTDLRGKRVGVPEYQQTSAIWTRGILEHEFGVHARDINWYMERVPERSHGSATGFTPPPGVKFNQIPASTSIGEMLVSGELDATLLYLNERNLVDRSKVDAEASSLIRPLFEDRDAEGQRYYAKTGIYPLNHFVVIRRSLVERHPWIALNMYSAFLAAKAEVERYGNAMLQPFLELGLLGPGAKRALTADPMAYGVKAARPVLEMIAQLLHEQGLTSRRVALEEVFAASTMDV
jgi:4,5-dihydroxyphthalate decarboxylase